MKKYSILFLFIISLVSFFSCKSDTTTKNNKIITHQKSDHSIAKLEKMEFHIKGMTCEIGCARLIQSKLSKKDGVKSIKVSFKDSIGRIEYDTNILSQKDITSFVDGIADGNLYKVTTSKKVEKFSNIK
ncbi:MAG: heavy metal-associated domain-containing protein [Flavobacteriaceae bacterium]